MQPLFSIYLLMIFIAKGESTKGDDEDDQYPRIKSNNVMPKRSISTSQAFEVGSLVKRTTEPGNQVEKESVQFGTSESQRFLQFLHDTDYDHRQLPDTKEGVNVNVSILVANVGSVSEATMDYTVELFFRERWLDERLRYNVSHFDGKKELSLHESYLELLWAPDTFIPNAVNSKNPKLDSITHRTLLRVSSEGDVLYSRRVSLTINCGMELEMFPFDTQICKMGVESYGHTANQVRYRWVTGEPLELSRIRLPDFTIEKAYVTNRTQDYATGSYSRLYVCFHFHRSAGYCILQLFIPATVVVFIAWMALWLKEDTALADIISLVLTIILLLYSYNSVMPKVSYIKAMDVYLGICLLALLCCASLNVRRKGVCFLTVFVTLIQLALVKWLLKHKREEDDKNKSALSFAKENITRYHAGSQVFFLASFVIFAIYYFTIFTQRSIDVKDADCQLSDSEFYAQIS